ncbi:putative histidine acid [Phaeomoniella chlamydospora]|uniref:Putative histidine acid n=1 Tax=Phaeomoniella chlamydospora TaxID=158046 RepID=A0A0G2GG82_PHACM|nr:putative histidine acid [Phaeomoniella chlamydospora]
MHGLTLFSLAAVISSAKAETVLGVYIFSRHGDRTSKSTAPTNLTDLGYQEVYTSGGYYRSRYIDSDATSKIHGINSDLVKLSQLTVSAPSDNVLMSSAIGFCQGLYPPVGTTLGAETLHNGTTVEAPLNGYQLIPVATVSTGTSSEDSAWLQGSSNCAKAEISSNSYYTSTEYLTLLNSTQDFYTSLTPMINRTFSTDEISFKNAYTIFDYLNVASIDNGTFPSEDLLTTEVLYQLRTLADNHEWNLAYNASESIRAISGATLAAQVVSALNGTITGKGKNKLNIQFGAYATFASYFGLAQLPAANSDFYGVSDYASTMVWELVTNATVNSSTSSWPSSSDISVRFLFHNGTTSNSSTPTVYPLFGGSETLLSWSDFVSSSNVFAISDQAQWCTACGNTTGVCAGYSSSSSTSSSSSSSSSSSTKFHHNMSNAVAGVVGAMVTLAVILGLEILVLLIGGFRIVSKKRLLAGGGDGAAAGGVTGGSSSSAAAAVEGGDK